MREEVIAKSYEFAMKYNIEEISLVKLSTELNISRRSLYRMFKDKYELMFEVYKIIVDELLIEAHNLNADNNSENGYDNTIAEFTNMITVFLDNPQKIKYITNFDALAIEDSDLLKEKNNFYRKCDFTYGALLKGVEDKSIRNISDPYKTSCIFLETALGVVSRFHNLDKTEYTDYMDREDIYDLIDMAKYYLKKN